MKSKSEPGICNCGSHKLAPLYHRPDCPALPLIECARCHKMVSVVVAPHEGTACICIDCSKGEEPAEQAGSWEEGYDAGFSAGKDSVRCPECLYSLDACVCGTSAKEPAEQGFMSAEEFYEEWIKTCHTSADNRTAFFRFAEAYADARDSAAERFLQTERNNHQVSIMEWEKCEESLKEIERDTHELLKEIDNWCSGENQVDDGENAEDALRYIQDAIRAFLARDHHRFMEDK